MAKKVFSKAKWLSLVLIEEDYNPKYCNILIDYCSSKLGWLTQCDGLTKTECEKMGYFVHDSWMIYKEDEENGN